MSSSTAQDDAPGTTASSPCFAIACHVWILCLLYVVLVFSSVAVAAAMVVLLPLACMATSLRLICAITAQLLARCFAPQDGEEERGGSEVAGSDEDGASSREEEEHEGESELKTSCCQECTAAYAQGEGDHQFSYPCGDEQEQFFWVDTGNYCYKKFYDLLAFWRRKERVGRR